MAALSSTEIAKIINLWNENTPDGVQWKFYHIAAEELTWRGREAAACLIDFYRIESNNDGSVTNRVEYNPVFSKTCQCGSRMSTESTFLVENSD